MPRQPTQPMPFFDHGVNPREMSDKLPEPWHNHRNEPVWSEEFSFISAKRIKDFLTENVDEHADHFMYDDPSNARLYDDYSVEVLTQAHQLLHHHRYHPRSR